MSSLRRSCIRWLLFLIVLNLFVVHDARGRGLRRRTGRNCCHASVSSSCFSNTDACLSGGQFHGAGGGNGKQTTTAASNLMETVNGNKVRVPVNLADSPNQMPDIE